MGTCGPSACGLPLMEKRGCHTVLRSLRDYRPMGLCHHGLLGQTQFPAGGKGGLRALARVISSSLLSHQIGQLFSLLFHILYFRVRVTLKKRDVLLRKSEIGVLSLLFSLGSLSYHLLHKYVLSVYCMCPSWTFLFVPEVMWHQASGDIIRQCGRPSGCF